MNYKLRITAAALSLVIHNSKDEYRHYIIYVRAGRAGRDVVSYFGQVGVAVVVVQVSVGVKAKPLAALDCGAIYEAACTWGVAVATVGGKGGYQHVGAEAMQVQCGAQRKLAVSPSYTV